MSADPTERALTLLSLLSSRATWRGPELAERLGVTERTVRRDIDRLRMLDYQVESTGGTGGGYRLRAGASIPPVFFDEDETIAVVAALLVAIGSQSTGMVDGSTRALGKLHHLLPSRLIHKVAAVQHSAVAVSLETAPQVDPKVVAALAEACRNRIAVTFGYRSRLDADTRRRVEPAAIVTARSVWYVIGFDLDRDDWRLFRVDRMRDVVTTGHGSSDRQIPGSDPMAFVGRSLATAPYAHQAEIVIDATAGELSNISPWVNQARVDAGPEPDGACVVRLSTDSLDDLVGQIIRLVGTAPVRSIAATERLSARLAGVSAVLASSLERR